MTNARLHSAASALCLVGLIMLPCAASGDALLWEDFNDLSSTDDSPVTWDPLTDFPGTYDASSGDYHLIPPPGGANISFMGALARDLSWNDMSIRTRVRKETESPLNSEYVSVFARVLPNDPTRPSNEYTAYEARLRQNGELLISRQNAVQNILSSTTVPFDVTQQDVMLQFDLFDDSLALWAWLPGDSMPSAPQVTAEDDTYGNGGIVLASTDGQPDDGGDSVGIFRYIHVADHHITDGDATDDGLVNIDDINAIRNNFGAVGAADGSVPGDTIPFDGLVNIDDLNRVRNNFGAGTTAVPEPSSAVLFSAFLVCAFWRFRRHHDRKDRG